jgi:hypothetical protein
LNLGVVTQVVTRPQRTFEGYSNFLVGYIAPEGHEHRKEEEYGDGGFLHGAESLVGKRATGELQKAAQQPVIVKG